MQQRFHSWENYGEHISNKCIDDYKRDKILHGKNLKSP